ncbi:TAXI family TRAP transporter solute-binding subunit [Salinibacillus xinjiangensis]|uniref:TAXI family TRAP transporter solute-binding subunit n=1 Tax=Salinibacillus xinjiangensis TaxID=1229268 RepID=A0A6G1X1P4_9BACI|nr:TAXI family TRAP transporter solute-binding subunit [Salinibacillus xinjiangensis]MRG84862.1 TAXI family TRAP transporter solute-binding subunit [Salinibacillus xinjiangensis]
MRFPRKKIQLFIFITFLAVILAACGEENAGTDNQSNSIEPFDPSTFELSDVSGSFNYAATSPSSGAFAFYAQIAALAEEHTNMDITVMETSGGTDSMKLLSQGQADFSLANNDTANSAYHGLEEFEGDPFEDLRMMYAWSVLSIPFYVTKESGVKTLEDLEGKTYGPGQRGSSFAKRAKQWMEVLDINVNWYEGSLDDQVSAVKNRKSIGFIKAGGMPDAAILDVHSTLPVDIISLSDEQIDIMQEVTPHLGEITIPAGAYEGVGEAKSLSTKPGEGVHKDIPVEVVYGMMKLVFDYQDELAEAYPTVGKFDLAEISLDENSSVPLHEGAVLFYQEELGLEVPDNLIPPEMK